VCACVCACVCVYILDYIQTLTLEQNYRLHEHLSRLHLGQICWSIIGQSSRSVEKTGLASECVHCWWPLANEIKL